MKKNYFLKPIRKVSMLGIFLFSQIFLSQQIGNYRTKDDATHTPTTGAWNTAGIWEVYNGTEWIPAIEYPGQSAGTYTVTISKNDTVTTFSQAAPFNTSTFTIGILNVEGLFKIDHDFVINLQNMNVISTKPGDKYFSTELSNGAVLWTGNYTLQLPSNSSIKVTGFDGIPTGTNNEKEGTNGLQGVTCNNNAILKVGTVQYAVCSGEGNSFIIFRRINETGGTLTSNPVVTPLLICSGESINLAGECIGVGCDLSPTAPLQKYVWTITGPTGYTTYTSNLQNPGNITLTIPGRYEVSFTINITYVSSNGNSTLPYTNTAKKTVWVDTDCDRISPDIDVDDDNDGILDVSEFGNCPTGTEKVLNGTFTSNTGWSLATGATITGGQLVVSRDTDGGLFTTNNDANKIVVASIDNHIVLDKNKAYVYSIDAFVSTSSTNNVDLSFVLIDGNGNIIQRSRLYKTKPSGGGDILLTTTPTTYTTSFIPIVSGEFEIGVTWDVTNNTAGDNVTFDNVSLKENNPCNTDASIAGGDALPNYLDNDSDADGCFDAIEGTGRFGLNSLNSSGQFTAAVHTSGALIGMPNLVGLPQGIGTSYDLVQGLDCKDFDNDGVADTYDLDTDNDGILDKAEGACEVIKSTPVTVTAATFPTAAFVENTSSDVTTVNSAGGTGTDDISFTLDKTGSVQVKYNNAYNYFNGSSTNSRPLTSLDDSNYTTFVLTYDSKMFAAPNSGIVGSNSSDEKAFVPLYISQVFGTGTKADPWMVKVEYYADIDRNTGYSSTKDIKITQINTYVAGEKVFRRDFKINIPGGLTGGVIKMFDVRDATFGGNTDAGYGLYGKPGSAMTYGTGTVVNDNINFIGITNTSASNSSGLFLGFLEITPFKTWFADRWNSYGSVSTNISPDFNVADMDNMNNGIMGLDSDIGFGVQYADVIPGATSQDVFISGYEIVADKSSICSAHRDTDNDGTPDYLDMDSDNDGCPDAIEGGDNVTSSMIKSYSTSPIVFPAGSITVARDGTGSTVVVDYDGVPEVVNEGGAADINNDYGQTLATSNDNTKKVGCNCHKTPVSTAAAAEDSKFGITAFGRAGSTNTNWPMVRKGGHLVLESSKKGFVITRMTKAEIEGVAASGSTPAVAPKITNPVTGMMVFDTTDNCIKIYVDATTKWKCFNVSSCPD